MLLDSVTNMAKYYRRNVTEREIIDILYDDSGSEGDLSEDFEDEDDVAGKYIYILSIHIIKKN